MVHLLLNNANYFETLSTLRYQRHEHLYGQHSVSPSSHRSLSTCQKNPHSCLRITFSLDKTTRIKTKANQLATNKEKQKNAEAQVKHIDNFQFLHKRQLTIFKSPPTKKARDVPANNNKICIMSAHLSQKEKHCNEVL